MTKAFSVFISDPHTIFREGLKKIISTKPGLIIAGESDSTSGLLQVLKECHPDLLIIYTIPIKSGIDAVESIQQELPELKIILLTNISRHPDLHNAIDKGINGIMHKAIGEKELLIAIEKVKDGIPFYSQEILPYILQTQNIKSKEQKHDKEDWSPKEITILKYIIKGYHNYQISELMNLKCRSIEGYKSRMIEKACVPNTINLVLFALKNKLVSINDL